jgi:CRP-like cAMP-binding protein
MTEELGDLRRVTVERYTPLCKRGEVGEAVWYIFRGQVAVIGEDESGAEKVLFIAENGDLVGEEVVFLMKYKFEVVALTEATLIKMSPKAFIELLGRESSFVRGIGFRLVRKNLRLSGDLMRISRVLGKAVKDQERIQVSIAERDKQIADQERTIKTLEEFLLSLTGAAEPRVGEGGLTTVDAETFGKGKDDSASL